MRLGLYLAFVAACFALDRDVGYLMTRLPENAAVGSLRCFVGIVADYNNTSIGTEVFCNGLCGSISTSVGGSKFTTYNCFPQSFCDTAGLNSTCTTVYLDRDLTGCCCNTDNCNVAGTNINTTIPVQPAEEPVACYSGWAINGVTQLGSGWVGCEGECMSITVNSTLNGNPLVASIYTCDPTSVCSALGVSNKCHDLEPGVVRGCCCDWDACINPTVDPPRVPDKPLMCYVGMVAPKAGVNVGAEVACSGRCGSLSGVVNGDNVITFQCVARQVCKTFLNANTCATLPGDREITGCCCNDRDSCNIYQQNATGIVIPTPSPIVEFPISCWTGIYVNGVAMTGVGFQTCNGQCASITLNTTLNGNFHTASMYMCDPTAVCRALNMTNKCNIVEPGIGGCCCDTDACIYPPRNRNPGNPLLCYVGMYAPKAGVNVGGEVACDGQCSTLSGTVNGDTVTTFQCAPLSVCKSLEIDNACTSLPGDREITGCCCDNANSCNAANYSMILPPTPPTNVDFPISCWSGVYVNGNAITKAGFQSCNGECASVTLQTTMNGQQHNATMYMCDPTTVCQALNMSNTCSTVEPGISGCCCDTDACLTPNKSPANPLLCYVGINAPLAQINVGAEIVCNGMCSSLNAMVNGDNVTTYQCVPKQVCKAFSAYNSCSTLKGDREVTGCCCDSSNSCNTPPNFVPPTVAPNTDFPISCWSGIYVNGQPLSNPGYQSCKGQCASLTLTTNIAGQTHNATMYTCDPSSVCKALNMNNQCQTLENGVSGCCCNSDACLTPRKSPGNALQCYVGLRAPKAGVNVGAEVYCDGMCSSLSGIVNGDNITTFQCVPHAICKSLAIDNACTSLPGDREVSGCCCDFANSCNLQLSNNTDIVPPSPPPNTEFPISCWSGIYVNGNALTSAGFRSCQGECASVTLQTTLNSQQHNATIYMCDPTSVCQALNMTNRCHTIEPGVSGCCCNDDGCLSPKKSPANPLTCYVGILAPKAGVNVGDEVRCNGMCSSLNAMVNNDNVTTFQCVPTSICKAFAADNGCSSIKGDREVTGCCCDTSNGCNAAAYNLTPPTPSPRPEFPISCWSGIYVNGQPLSPPSFQSCSGECASLTISTIFQGQNHTATMYTCDPSDVCKTLGIVNNCTDIEPGISTCCCNTDACLTPRKKPGKPLLCYVGLNAPLAGVNVGAEVACNGMCASLRGIVNGDNVTTFQCVPNQVCKTFLNRDGCASLQGDREITGCCCDERDSCNFHMLNRTDIIMPTPSPIVEFPISCWTGIYVNGNPLTSAGFTTCNGQCASVTLNTTINGNFHTASMYMCDPTAVCRALNMTNRCDVIEPGVGGCCCDTDACIYPPKNRSPGNPLMCYVGLYAPNAGVNVGGEVFCNGQCSTLSGIVNGDTITTFQCSPISLCKSLEIDNACTTLPGDRAISACCCDSSSNCNIANYAMIIPPRPSPPEVPISCWSGITVDGMPVTEAGFTTCYGECASLTLQTTMNGQQHNASIFMCDPTAVCQALNMTNTCSTIEPGVSGCCCNTDACLAPWRSPTDQLYCYVGMHAPKAGVNTGAEVPCNGRCSSLRAMVNGDDVTTFQCMSTSACSYLGADFGCNRLQGDREVVACCCDYANACNVMNRTDIVIPTPSPIVETPISCWSGIYVHGTPITSVGYSTCYGECASASLTTNINGETHTAEIYTCDPTSVCSAIGMINNCMTVEPGVRACCCNTDACLTPKRKPGNVLWCYVGLYAAKAGVNVGGEVACDGQCSSLSGIVNGDSVTTFQCVPNTICRSLGIGQDSGGCVPLPGDREVSACCCSDQNSCNVYQLNRTDITPATPSPVQEYPISCWTGIYLNGNALTSAGFSTCYGECASVSLQTTLNNQQHNATIYMCDPTSICQALNMSNSCATVEPGLSGCCCNDDACLTPTKSPLNNPLTCYVGLNAPKAQINTGAEVICQGMCSSLNAIVNGDNVTTFQCVPRGVCKSFGLGVGYGCQTLKGDREVTGCCCDNANGCNLAARPDIIQPTLAPYQEFPISCWSGVYVNGMPLSNPGYSTCRGECASLTLVTQINGVTHNATMYTCDPSSVCKSLNMDNQCTTLETGVSGCCCNTDACLTPNRIPGKKLWCYVGLIAKKAGVNVGAEVACDGMCSSLSGTVNGDDVVTFQCVPNRVCKTFLNTDGCAKLQGDREITGCCCRNGDSCNVAQLNRTDIILPTPSPVAEYPISCWTGIYVNGQSYSNAGFTTCYGDCASVSLSTSINGQNHTATMYMCDPTSVCRALNMSNQCSTVEPGVSGCCCNTDGCLNPNNNVSPGNPLVCYVGIYYEKDNYSVGSEMPCAGKCASLQTTFGGKMLKSYHCAPTQVCKQIADNGCSKIYKDSDVVGCCCDTSNNCNVKEPISTNNTFPPFTGTPIACQSGIYVDGVPLTKDNTFIACKGQCAKLSYATNLTGVSHTLDIYSCDPASVCSGLGLSNGCSTIDGTNVSGCCCNYDGCVTPASNPTPTTGSGSTLSMFIVFIAAVYTLLRQ
uniref:ET module n=1 Tax=Haemonchus contortus TaxID=6289 RepID=A0A7I4Z011_HAECO